MGTINQRAAIGGAVTGCICAGAGIGLALMGSLLFGWGTNGRTAAVSVFGVIGFILGGFRAGLLQRSAPLSNGAAAGFLTSVPLSIVGLIQNPGRLLSVIFAAFLGASLGTFGAMVSNYSSLGK
jgi:hypothetical protein